MSEMTKEEFLQSYNDGNRNFKGKDLSGLWLTLSDFSDCDFSNSDLRGTNFAKTVLENCKFDGAWISGANFDYTDVDGSSFINATANWKTSFKNMYLGSATLPKLKKETIDVTKPIVQGDITTVSEEVWANEWRVHAPDKENVLSFGGSFLGDLFNVNTFACTLESINEKKGILPKEKKQSNKASFNAGHRYEPFVAQQFVEYMTNEGHTVELITDTNMYQHPLHPYVLCDMDYLCKVDGELCILECKTCNAKRYEEIENLKAKVLNKAYFLQTNLYLSIGWLLAQINTCYVCDVWGFRACDDDMAVIKVTRNEQFEADLFANLDVMYDAIKNEEELDLSGSNPLALSDYYRRLYGIPETDEKKNETITLSDGVKQTLDEIILLETEKKEHEAQAKNIKENLLPEKYNRLSPLFGSALNGVLTIKGTRDFYSVIRDPYERCCTFDKEMFLNEFPEDAKKYSKKVIKSTVFESAVAKLKNGMLSVDDFIAQMEAIEDTFDEDEFLNENRKNSKLVAPYTKCYYKRPKQSKSGIDKIPDTFSVAIKTFKN